MDISFSSKKLGRQLASEKEMSRAFGHVMPALRRRLDVLRHVNCLAEVPHSKPDGRHELFHERQGHFAVWLTANYRLIFKPSHDRIPRRDDGGIDLGAITAVEIVDIEDYHGK